MLTKIRDIGRAVRAFATRDPDLRVRRIYELPYNSDPYADRETHYVNIGYWDSDDITVDEASGAIAMKLAEAAGLGPGQVVLDVGCGYGDQDFLWLKEFAPRSIDALDVTTAQIYAAKQRAMTAEVTNRLRFKVGTATALPFADAAFDRVISLDAAFHFTTREDFFREAMRVLRPGGVLATMDTIPLDNAASPKSLRSKRFTLYRHAVPEANWYDRDAYATKLAGTGFTDVTVTSIRDHTWEPWFRYWSRIATDPAARERADPTALAAVDYQWRDIATVKQDLARLDSVIAVATKPAG